MIGMALGNCLIVTTQGPMANEAWLDKVTKACKDLSRQLQLLSKQQPQKNKNKETMVVLVV